MQSVLDSYVINKKKIEDSLYEFEFEYEAMSLVVRGNMEQWNMEQVKHPTKVGKISTIFYAFSFQFVPII